MARSRAARRRARNMNEVIPYARMRPNVTDWKIGGSATDNTGAVIGGAAPTGPSTWNLGVNDYALASGVPVTYQAVVLIAAPNTSTPQIGRMRIDEIKGHICFNANTLNAKFAVAVAIYVSEFNSNSNTWDVRDPLNTADAARDDYFYLEAQELIVPALATTAGVSNICFDLKLANALVIGGGQALHVTVSMYSGGPASPGWLSSMFRTRCGPVA